MPLTNKTIIVYDSIDVITECSNDLNISFDIVDCILTSIASNGKGLVNGQSKSFYEGTFDELISDIKLEESDNFYSPVTEMLNENCDEWLDINLQDKILLVYSIKQWMRKNSLLDENLEPKITISFTW